MTTIQTPNLAQLVIEHWRSGPRWRSRLSGLASHFAGVYGVSSDEVYHAALQLAFDGEIKEG
jgi:hypothetical protein